MAQSLVKNFVHITFSTKHREPLIDENIEHKLYSYIAGICNNLACTAIKVGGYLDHVHLLVSLSKKIAMMTLLEKVKSNSSKWIKTQGSAYENFYWQAGYGAFSISQEEVEQVKHYISNQKEYHKSLTYQDEMRKWYARYQMDYDERYVWD